MGIFSSSKSRLSSSSPLPQQTFTFSISRYDHDHDISITIFRSTPTTPETPTFTFSYHYSNPNLIVSRLLGPQRPPMQIAHGDFEYPSKANVMLHNRTIELRPHHISGTGNRFSYPGIGDFKWSGDNIIGSSIYLHDESRGGIVVAKYKPKRVLEVYVQGSEEFVDLVVVTALAAAGSRELDKKVGEGIGTAVGAVAGAASS
jgi:hypothetical protein